MLQTMASQRRLAPPAAAAVAVFIVVVSATVAPASAAVVEHTFVVRQVKMTHLCKETVVTVVNGQLPGPAIEATEGDTVAVHVVNESPYNMTIHWHGVRQRLSCWADGVPMVTQCPILPGRSFTYRFAVAGQEGTLWWHAHVACLRASLHGALIVRPRNNNGGAGSSYYYPFPKPDREVPVVIGDLWDMDLEQLDRNMMDGYFADSQTASTINGKLGDLYYGCEEEEEDGYVLDVEPGKTYLLRLINAGLYAEYYVKVAGHRFTVVVADANYVNPFVTDVVAIAPGETVDVLMVADAAPGRSYYMVALAMQPPEPDPQVPVANTRGMVRYRRGVVVPGDGEDVVPVVVPDMPDMHDVLTTFYFHGNLTSMRRPAPVPARADERMFVTLGVGSICREGESCERSGSNESIIVATMNDVSFQEPSAGAAASLLEAHYHHRDDAAAAAAAGVELRTLPDAPLRVFNFTDEALVPWGPVEARLEPTEKETLVRRFRHGAVVDVVFQSTAVMQSGSNPMHLHGHDMFVLAQGFGNYDAARDVARYNLVDPPVKNTVVVPGLGWAAVRFVADNPGVWYMHCHFEFHMSMGMIAVFIVEDGSSVDTSLPPPPVDFPKCDPEESLAVVPDKFGVQNVLS